MKDSRGLAVITGSGMADLGHRLVRTLTDVETVPFEEIDGVGACTVEGHLGAVRLGRSVGAGGRRVALVLGRRHTYEGEALGMAPLMRWLVGREVASVVTVSAAGSLKGTFHPGELMVATEIMDFQNRALRQPAVRRFPIHADDGPRPASERAGRAPGVSTSLTDIVERAARRAGVALQRGVLACGSGPAYETPAEVRALQAAGADVATMSAAPEVQYAAEFGMEIAIVAAITNRCTGIGLEPPEHARVLELAKSMCGSLEKVLCQLL